MDKNLKFYDLFQHADFINERHGMDSIAVDSIPIPGAEVDPEWKNYIIPTWVADQSFKTCPAIQDAVIARAKHPAFGYFRPRDEYFEGIIRWQKNQYDSDVTREDIVYANGLLGGVISALNVFCEKGANVLLHAPTYIGFTGCITNNGYHIVHSWLKKDENGVWRMDYEDMEKKIVENNIHATVFCTPHNPCGRVWTKEELEKAYAIFEKYDVKVVADQIWADCIHVGYKHCPPENTNAWAQQNTISFYAPSKTFNLAGFVGSYGIIRSKYWRDRWNKEASLSHYNDMNVLWMHAMIGAYSGEDGYEWVKSFQEAITENSDLIYNTLKSVPGIEVAKPEGTFMIYAQFDKYLEEKGMTIDELQKKGVKYGVIWQDGRPFHAPNSIRLNMAIPTEACAEMARRLKEYIL